MDLRRLALSWDREPRNLDGTGAITQSLANQTDCATSDLAKELPMSECLHCDIHELLDSQLQGKEANLAEIAAKVTEVLADIILTAPPDDQATLMADVLANLGSFLLEKKEEAGPTNPNPRRSRH
jgi:hypothetical protein